MTASRSTARGDWSEPVGFPRWGIYGISRERDRDSSLLLALQRSIAGGLRAFQYRRKAEPSGPNREPEAARLLAVCRAHRVPFIVNDDIQLALDVGADGVHLGRDDGSPVAARALLGSSAIIGVSCYDSVARAQAAAQAGADYVAFGRFFPSRTKPLAAPARLETLREARALLKIPIVAIGGVTPDNGAALLAAGADVLAVVDAVYGAEDPEQAVRVFAPLFAKAG